MFEIYQGIKVELKIVFLGSKHKPRQTSERCNAERRSTKTEGDGQKKLNFVRKNILKNYYTF